MAQGFDFTELGNAFGAASAKALSGAGFAESMDLMRKAWSAFSLPSSFAPTIDPDEIEQRANQLRAVEQWLSMNLTMLRGSIQAFEMQANTLRALHTLRDSGAAVAAAATQGASAAGVSAAAAATPGSAEPAGDKGAAAATRSSGRARKATAESAASAGEPQAATAAQEFDPLAWWDLLQGQFSQIANAAITSIPTLPLPPHPAMTPFGAGIAVPPTTGQGASAAAPAGSQGAPSTGTPAQAKAARDTGASAKPASGKTPDAAKGSG